MNKLTVTLIAAVGAGVLFLGAPQDAHAGHPLTRGLGGYYGGCADGLSLYRSGNIPVPPYFALHPPVYYSAPVARSYGYSPFPYSADVRTPNDGEPAAVIINPHVVPAKQSEEKKKAELSDDSVAQVTPEIIRNPFVDVTPYDSEIHVAKTVKE